MKLHIHILIKNIFLKEFYKFIFLNFSIAYRKPTGQKPVNCGFDKMPGQGEICAVDVSNFSDCSPQMGYSYNRSSPCVFLKLNKVYKFIYNY